MFVNDADEMLRLGFARRLRVVSDVSVLKASKPMNVIEFVLRSRYVNFGKALKAKLLIVASGVAQRPLHGLDFSNRLKIKDNIHVLQRR